MRLLDLFSAAAGGWSLGLHRAGFRTVAACEFVDWRRSLDSVNNPGVVIYDDVRTLTADRIVSDLGYFPEVVVGSPPCQDISSANTKGKGVEGERSGLFFEAVRIIGEGRPRWFALENSSNLRTRGADAVLAALEELGYACWPVVVRAGHGRGGAGIGANHERPRSWLIGCDVEQLADPHGHPIRLAELSQRSFSQAAIVGYATRDPDGDGRAEEWNRRRSGQHISDANDLDRQGSGVASNASEDGCGQGRSRGCALSTQGISEQACWDASNASQERQEDGAVVGGVCAPTFPETGCHDGQGDDGSRLGEMGGSESAGGSVAEPWADWNGGLAHHLRMDDGLSAWVAQSRIAVGGPKGTSAASLIVEAFGDAVVPQIPEAIGRAILRTEAAIAAVYRRRAE